jgi:hypothetical protein
LKRKKQQRPNHAMAGRCTFQGVLSLHKTNTTNPSPASTLEIICSDFKPYSSRTLIGFVTLSFPAVGLSLHECTYHRTEDGKAWVGFPARAYIQDGAKKWKRLADTLSKEAHYRFQHVAVRAIEKFLAEQKQKAAPSVPKTVIPKW